SATSRRATTRRSMPSPARSWRRHRPGSRADSTGQHAPQHVVLLHDVMIDGGAGMHEDDGREHIRADDSVVERIEEDVPLLHGDIDRREYPGRELRPDERRNLEDAVIDAAEVAEI